MFTTCKKIYLKKGPLLKKKVFIIYNVLNRFKEEKKTNLKTFKTKCYW